MILIPSVAPKLAWQQDQSRCVHVQNQEYSLKMTFFQILTCGHQRGKNAKQSVRITKAAITSAGSRTLRQMAAVGCFRATTSPSFTKIAMPSVARISALGLNCPTATNSEQRSAIQAKSF
mmetsp:Transcript_100811/g.123462  ORF Transcript_100811/g.123462 Transcript_100811/m.123462 type:complete len:120 (+) Transcript_100811:318-677(+)